jgi:HSP20 family protein
MATTVTRYQPSTPMRLSEIIERLMRESFIIPTLTERVFRGETETLPSNLLETEDAFIVELVLPGVDPDKLEIHVKGRELIVKGSMEVPPIEKATYIWQGFTGGDFTQRFTLPTDVDGDKAEAQYIHGILTVTVPKAEHIKPTAIKVNVK